MNPPQPIPLTLLFTATVALAPRVELGAGPRGVRGMVPILSGTFAGPQMRGSVLPGGADWQVTRPDGVTEIEAHYTLQTDDCAILRVINRGFRHGPAQVMARLARGEAVDAAEYYFRAAPVFEAPQGRYDWLNRNLFLSTGERYPGSVVLHFFQVL